MQYNLVASFDNGKTWSSPREKLARSAVTGTTLTYTVYGSLTGPPATPAYTTGKFPVQHGQEREAQGGPDEQQLKGRGRRQQNFYSAQAVRWGPDRGQLRG